MDVSEDRGIECRGVCFNYIDSKVTLKVYQNLPGITRELAGTTFEKSFSLDEWKDINSYLMGILDRVEGVFDDVIEIDSEGKVHPPEAVKVLSEISQLRGEPVFPGRMIPLKEAEARISSNIPKMTENKEEVTDITPKIVGEDGEE